MRHVTQTYVSIGIRQARNGPRWRAPTRTVRSAVQRVLANPAPLPKPDPLRGARRSVTTPATREAGGNFTGKDPSPNRQGKKQNEFCPPKPRRRDHPYIANRFVHFEEGTSRKLRCRLPLRLPGVFLFELFHLDLIRVLSGFNCNFIIPFF